DENVGKALRMLKARLSTAQWARASLNEVIKDVVKANGLKMPQLAMPLRRLVTGRTQTPSIDAVLELLGREVVLQRLTAHLDEDRCSALPCCFSSPPPPRRPSSPA